MAIVKELEKEGTLEFKITDYFRIEIDMEKQEVMITTHRELPPLEPKKTTFEEGRAGLELGKAFSKTFGVLVLNKVPPDNEAPEPVHVALEDLRKKTRVYLNVPHSGKELAVIVKNGSRELAELAAFENLPSPYIQPALEELKKVMRQAILDRPKLPKTT